MQHNNLILGSGMSKISLLYGAVLGFAGTILGCILFIALFTDYEFTEGVAFLQSQGKLAKLVTIGSIINLITFGILLKVNKDMMARGVILAVILTAIATLFI